MPKFPTRACSKPTVRLLTYKNCEAIDEKFGISILETSPPLQPPQHHSAFELDDLPRVVPRENFGMPWEGTDNQAFRRFRNKLPKEITPESIYTNVALPTLQLPVTSQQRSQEWHTARSFAVTASSFAGTSENADTLLKTKTYPKANGFTGNAYTEWGTLHEKHAEEAFVQFLSTHGFKGELTHPAHIRDPERPFLGFSPDALLWSEDHKEVDLVEYKCPAARRFGPGHPYSDHKLYVPSRYMPQLQGSMLLLRASNPGVRCVRAWFVVWQPHQFFVTNVPYVHLYASKTVELAETFFHGRFLPACADAVIKREKSMLTFKTEEACFEFHEESALDAMNSTASSASDLAPAATSSDASSEIALALEAIKSPASLATTFAAEEIKLPVVSASDSASSCTSSAMSSAIDSAAETKTD